MPNIEIKLKTDNTELIKQATRQAVRVALEAVGLQAENNTKTQITKVGAVDTGRLRNSITHTSDEDTAYVGTNVEYAAYVEYGTSKMAARPYLKPAVNNNAAQYRAIFEDFLRNA